MRLTTKGRFAVTAMIDLALHNSDGPVTLATGGKRVDGVDLIAKGISLTVTGSNGDFNVTVDGKDAELTVSDGNTKLAIVTAQNGGKLSLSNGTFSRVAVKDDSSSASLSGGSYGEITSDEGEFTIEDLIETVIGEIEDEHDEIEGGLAIQEKPGQWLIQARAPLEDVEAETGLRLASEEDGDDIDTLGGLIFMLTGRVPVRGEVIPHDSGAEFEIVDADPRRIKSVRIVRNDDTQTLG